MPAKPQIAFYMILYIKVNLYLLMFYAHVFLSGQFLYDQKRVVEAAAMFTKAMELAPGDFEIAFTAAGYLRYILVQNEIGMMQFACLVLFN